MKKKIIIFLTMVLLLSGCAKSTTTTKVKINKSLDFESELLLSNKLERDVLMEISQDKLTAAGFNISVAQDGDYKGVKISKRYSNIDKYSNDKGETVVITDLLRGEIKDNILFRVEKSFFKNTYQGKYKYNLASELFTYTNDNKVELSDDSRVSLEGEMYYKYIVKLPFGSIYNNANEVLDDGKTLVWNLNPSEDTEIRYHFILYNIPSVIIAGISALVGIIFVLVVLIAIIKRIKKNNTQAVPIHVDYDPSIEDKLNEFEAKEEEKAPEVAETENNKINDGTFEYNFPTENEQKLVMKEVKEMQKPEKKENKFIVDVPDFEPVDYEEEKKKNLP